VNQQMVVGLVILALSCGLLVVVAASKAESVAYLSSVLAGELGAMLLLTGMFAPGAARTSVAAFFAISIGWTVVQLLKARPKPPKAPPLAG
jgi:hypothetical protein